MIIISIIIIRRTHWSRACWILSIETLLGTPASQRAPNGNAGKPARPRRERPERRTGRSTFVSGRPERRTGRSTFVFGRPERRTGRSTFIFGRPERRTGRSTFVFGRPERKNGRSTDNDNDNGNGARDNNYVVFNVHYPNRYQFVVRCNRHEKFPRCCIQSPHYSSTLVPITAFFLPSPLPLPLPLPMPSPA